MHQSSGPHATTVTAETATTSATAAAIATTTAVEPTDAVDTTATVTAVTRAWVEHAVIGLGLCPFAKAPQQRGQVRYVVSAARDADALLTDLADELERLDATPTEQLETTLLVHPQLFADFADYNDFLDLADAALAALGLDGVLQVASFHPHYQFAGSAPDDVANATNRSPYPTLHLLREASIDRAVAAFPRAEAIFEANIATLRSLGDSGWAALQRRCRAVGGAADHTNHTDHVDRTDRTARTDDADDAHHTERTDSDRLAPSDAACLAWPSPSRG